jgi:ribosomal protein L12E/L44/L45/RPP1/RPP2
MRKLIAITTALSVLGLTGVMPLYTLATAQTATDPAKSDPPKAPKKAKKKKKKEKEKEKEKTGMILYRIAA